MDALIEIARRRRLRLVEDACACHAVGGAYKGRPLGSMGDAGCFSFGRFKGLSTLEGGALVFSREAWRERLARLRRLGHKEEDGAMAEGPDGVSELGFHYRMSDLAAAVGLSQLKRRAEIQARLDEVLARYREGLRGLPWLRLPAPKPYSAGVRGYAAVRVLGGRRDALRRRLLERGVQVNDSLYPSHLYRLYRPFRRRLPRAERFCEETLHLPYYPDLTGAEIDRVVDEVRRFDA
jgi:dTDP-4-amino-4,6-dideoxygalactose transaminase